MNFLGIARKIGQTAVMVGAVALGAVTSSGALLSWETADFTKFTDAGQAIAHNSFLILDLLPYMILVMAVVYIINKVFGIFRFGGGA